MRILILLGVFAIWLLSWLALIVVIMVVAVYLARLFPLAGRHRRSTIEPPLRGDVHGRPRDE